VDRFHFFEFFNDKIALPRDDVAARLDLIYVRFASG
jgi:hypothetical protein